MKATSTITSQRSADRAPRSFSGCVQCKKSKRKCPEQRPECARCVKSGLYDFGKTMRFEMQPVEEGHPSTKGRAISREPPPLNEIDQADGNPGLNCTIPGNIHPLDIIPTQSTTPDPDSSAIRDIDGHMIVTLSYQPLLDTYTRELATLNSIKEFTANSPGACYSFYELFPLATDEFIYLSLGNDGLRHSLLAVGSAVRDVVLNRQPGEFYFLQKTKALRFLQEAIEGDRVDELLLVSVALQIATDICCGNLSAAERHLNGLYLIYLRLKQNSKSTGSQGKGLTPLARFVIRMGACVDFSSAPLFNAFPRWPVMTFQDEMEDRQFLRSASGSLTKGVSSEDIEWAFASFEVDNLIHLTYRFAKRSDIYRTSGRVDAEQKIKLEYEKVLQRYQAWKQRNIVIKQEQLERYAQMFSTSEDSTDADSFHRFLWHEPLIIQNTHYAKILNQYRAGLLQASFILHPVPGPLSSDRFQLAVDICRTHAALGSLGVIGPAWQSLFYAGLAFGGERMYPRECEWIMERLRGIARTFPILEGLVEKMPQAWEKDNVGWNVFGGLMPPGLCRDDVEDI